MSSPEPTTKTIRTFNNAPLPLSFPQVASIKGSSLECTSSIMWSLLHPYVHNYPHPPRVLLGKPPRVILFILSSVKLLRSFHDPLNNSDRMGERAEVSPFARQWPPSLPLALQFRQSSSHHFPITACIQVEFIL